MQPTSHHQPLFVVMAHNGWSPQAFWTPLPWWIIWCALDICVVRPPAYTDCFSFYTNRLIFSAIAFKLVDPFFSGGFGQILWRGLQGETVETCGNRFSACHIFIWGEEKQRGLPTLRPYLDPEGWNLCGYIHVPTGWSFCFFEWFFSGCLVAIAMLLSGLEGNTLFSLWNIFFFTVCLSKKDATVIR